jgi:predicted 3-demethylubiquinone-9 3-methyltransferase (glyoxalase superfamily)
MATIKTKQKVTPFLWFDNKAEEAMNYYTSVFKKSKIVSISRDPKGRVFSGVFQIEGQNFNVLNGGPMFKFTEAISFFVSCKTQKEVDDLWDKLSKGGEKGRCGWLKDKFGLSWQIIPDTLGELMGDKDPVKAQKVIMAMMKMDKIIIKDLKKAYNQK